jgi:hypothetical protein
LSSFSLIYEGRTIKTLHQRYFSVVLARAGFQLFAGASVSLKVALVVAIFSLGQPLFKAACVMAGSVVVVLASLISGCLWLAVTAWNKKAAWVGVAGMMLAEAVQIVLAACGFLILMFELQQYEKSLIMNVNAMNINAMNHPSVGPAFLLLGFIVAIIASVLMFLRKQN